LKKFTKNLFGKERVHADEARKALEDCQIMIDQCPNDSTYRVQENDLMIKFLDAIRIEEEVAKQKSRNQWLELGDRNTNYFYNAIKSRRNINRISVLSTPDGSFTSNEMETKEEVIRYFDTMLGTKSSNQYPGVCALQNIVTKRVSDDHYNLLNAPLMRLKSNLPCLAFIATKPQDQMGLMHYFSNIVGTSWALLLLKLLRNSLPLKSS